MLSRSGISLAGLTRALPGRFRKRAVGIVVRGDYVRLPRCLPAVLQRQAWKRASLGCRDCRRRVKPPSLRFPNRRAFNPWFHLMVSEATVAALQAARVGRVANSLAALARTYDASRSTLRRWMREWRRLVGADRCWRALRLALSASFDPALMPWSLVEQFDQPNRRLQRFRALKFLSPLWVPDRFLERHIPVLNRSALSTAGSCWHVHRSGSMNAYRKCPIRPV